MNTNPLVLALLCALFVASSADAQGNLAPRHIAVPARKIVCHDLGDFWPATYVLHTNGTVSAIGNGWLSDATKTLAVTGVTDMARLDALYPGESESVAMVSGGGLTMVHFDTTYHEYVEATWTNQLLQGAVAVRCAPIPPTQHAVAVLTSDGRTLRTFRKGGAAMGAFTMPNTVSDFAVFRHNDGTARLLVLSANELSCRRLDGTVQWTAPGVGGDIVTWPGDPAVTAAWLHRDPQLGSWRLALLGQDGALSVADASATIAASENLVAAFAADSDADGHVDLLVKTSNGRSVLINDGANHFLPTAEHAVLDLLTDSQCIPDLMITHRGRRVRMVDEQTLTSIAWKNLDVDGGGWGDGITMAPAQGLVSEPSPTKLGFKLAFSEDWFDAFTQPGLTTSVQVIAWRQERPDPEVLDESPEPNVLVPLLPEQAPPDPLPVDLRLDPSCYDDPILGWTGWESEEHYWLTIRLVLTDDPQSLDIIAASDPVLFGTTLANSLNGSWSYLRSHMEVPTTPPADLPRVSLDLHSNSGGGVVGVIPKIIVPPPPPPSGVAFPGKPKFPL